MSGRGLFDVAHGWGGKRPVHVPVFVVTHHVPQEWVNSGAPFTFVTDGQAAATRAARGKGGGRRPPPSVLERDGR